jgi:transcriptional regulator
MYIPEPFRVDDSQKLYAFIEAHSFGTIVSGGARANATHLPFLVDLERGEHGTLLAHFARANPHWKEFKAGGEALVIFQGPHCYLSPAWYDNQVTVPTWAYSAVHVRGPVQLLDSAEQVRPLVERLVDHHENAWSLDKAAPVMDQLLKMIVGFEIPITSIEGKFKFNQNTSKADQIGVVDALSSSIDPNDQAVGAIMKENLESDS